MDGWALSTVSVHIYVFTLHEELLTMAQTAIIIFGLQFKGTTLNVSGTGKINRKLRSYCKE
jgi:hypothetical protein